MLADERYAQRAKEVAARIARAEGPQRVAKLTEGLVELMPLKG